MKKFFMLSALAVGLLTAFIPESKAQDELPPDDGGGGYSCGHTCDSHPTNICCSGFDAANEIAWVVGGIHRVQ